MTASTTPATRPVPDDRRPLPEDPAASAAPEDHPATGSGHTVTESRPTGDVGQLLSGGLLNPEGRPAVVRLAFNLLNDRRIRYIIVGGIAAVVYYSFFTIIWLVAKDHLHYLAVAVIAGFGNAVTTFPLYRKYVFQSTGPYLRTFFKFYALCIGSTVYTFVGMPLLVEVAHVPVLISQAILVVTWPLLNYQLNKYWAFRSR